MTADREEKFNLEEAICILEATPQALRALLEGLPYAWLDFRKEPDAWNPRTVLVHFIHNEVANWMPRARVILSGAEVRRFAPFQQLPDESEYGALDVPQLLAKFAELRRANLSELQDLELGPADYARERETILKYSVFSAYSVVSCFIGKFSQSNCDSSYRHSVI